MQRSIGFLCGFFGFVLFASQLYAQAESPTGAWRAVLHSPGGELRFGLRLKKSEDGPLKAEIINSAEVIEVDDVSYRDGRLTIDFPHYDSKITASRTSGGELAGVWKKVSSGGKISQLRFSASRQASRAATNSETLKPFLGRWRVKFSSSSDPAVAIFAASRKQGSDQRPLEGTFLTTTGDYRYLAGEVVEGKLELSVFDGAHAFLFRATRREDGRLQGDFWSRDTWHETWTAVRDDKARLPDAFAQTRWTGKAKLGDLKFPNLAGQLKALDDPMFAGKVRIITVFGSWCPNCHDSALYLSELHERYGAKGLSIVGLAFELTGDFERDAKQVRRYLERHNTQYPVLLAGLSDKKKASATLPVLDRVRSFPTTIFLNEKNEVISIHTGFSGPATGEAYRRLRTQFEAIIEKQLRL